MEHHATAKPLQVSLDGGRSYPIRFGALDEVPAHMDAAGLRQGRCVVVTDENVAAHYLEGLAETLKGAGWTPKTVVLPPGEETKSPRHLQALYDEILPWGIDRQTPVLALGGGVVGDLAGFAAATLLRGVPLVQLPTSLIAQVDSAIGGKTGINHSAGKNLIGAFKQPAFVLIDPSVLHTLPKREWTSGLAEVVKHTLIGDEGLVEFLEANWEAVLNRDADVIGPMLRRAARVKVHVVSEDEREAGRRAILNFGHTFGHAIERVAGYGAFTHGEAVAVGMRAALYLSRHLHPDFPLERADHLVRSLPVHGDPSSLSMEALIEAMRFDKKVQAGTVRFVVLRRIGEAYLTGEVSSEAVEAAWAFAKEA